MSNSIEFNEGYIKCLEELSSYMVKKKKSVTLMQLNSDFISPKLTHAQEDIGKVLEDMHRDYLNDELKRKNSNNKQ